MTCRRRCHRCSFVQTGAVSDLPPSVCIRTVCTVRATLLGRVRACLVTFMCLRVLLRMMHVCVCVCVCVHVCASVFVWVCAGWRRQHASLTLTLTLTVTVTLTLTQTQTGDPTPCGAARDGDGGAQAVLSCESDRPNAESTGRRGRQAKGWPIPCSECRRGRALPTCVCVCVCARARACVCVCVPTPHLADTRPV